MIYIYNPKEYKKNNDLNKSLKIIHSYCRDTEHYLISDYKKHGYACIEVYLFTNSGWIQITEKQFNILVDEVK